VQAWLFFLALPLQLAASFMSGIGFVVGNPALVLTGTVLFAGWFVLTWWMATKPPRVLRDNSDLLRRIATGIAITVLAAGLAEAVMVPVLQRDLLPSEKMGESARRAYDDVREGITYGFGYNDGTVLTHQAVENLLRGTNPYAGADMVAAAQRFGTGPQILTPLRRGRFADVFPFPSPSQIEQVWPDGLSGTPEEIEGKFNYPAALFLLPVPFVALGLSDLRVLLAAAACLPLIWIAWKIRPGRRLVFVAAALASLEVANAIATGETGSLVFAFLLLAWVLLERRSWLSVILMAIAVSTKQTSWFYLPFFLIRVWSTGGARRALLSAGLIAGLFAVINLPFAVGDPGLWLKSVFAPMTDPMFPFGVGIVTLVTTGLVDLRTSLPFTIAEILVFAGGIVWYARNCRRYTHAGPVLAILPLFFAWRSLWPYFYYANIIVLAGVLLEGTGRGGMEVVGEGPDPRIAGR